MGSVHFGLPSSIMKRRKHLTGPECQELAQSREGLCALTQPFNQWNTKQDVHRGLYPRSRAERCFRGKGGKSTLSTSHNILSTDISPSCSHSQEMAEYVSSRMDEDAVESDSENDVHPSDLHSSRKRPYSSIESISQNFLPVVDTRTSSSNFLEEDDDDDEMGLMLDSLSESCYGLLGVTDQSQPSCGHINQFPDELLQCIFSFLPAVDLYRNISLVCHKWKSLVHDSLFIKWKKLYHRYLAKDGPAVMEIEDLLKKNGIIADNPLCILELVKYFTTFCHVADSQAILECLKNHHLYEIAEKCVTQRLPELTCNNEAVNAWAVLAVIALLSIKVGDIQRLIRCLWHFRSPLRLVEVMEALYCLATLLFAMREQKVLVSNRIHYNIFYSLYLLENSSSQKKIPSCENARPKPTFNLTNEQQQIINHDIQEGQVMKIMAFAGTGKTSTLIKYAERRPHLRFLYATFNKSIANHAVQNFPKNVVCKTFHSLAYHQTGKLYQQRKKLNPSKLTPYTVNFVLPKGQAGFVRAKLVVKTLENFLASADEAIETDHVPIWYKNNCGEREMVNPWDQQFAVREADKIWQRMQSLEETREYAYKMTHDGYLKLWQLRRPNLSYDAIFVDEAQDCTPSIMEVVLSQKCGKIFVGDPHQQIYTFRGAVNALCEVPHTHIFYLTQSFRFGAEIAYIGATILDACKKIRRKTLVGGNQEGTVREHFQTKVAILSRTNACVFDQAVSVTDKENPSLIHIIGGAENFGLSKIYDIWVLLQPESERQKRGLYIKDRFIATWQKKGFTALKVYAVSSEDKELEGKIAVVEKYKHRIPELVNKIEGCHINDTSHADYILGTVHKAKGMEFDAVQVTDDFAKIPSARHNLERLQIPFAVLAEDEWNLLYVAVTRARKHLTITKSVENIMTLAGEYSLKAELTSQMLKDGPVQCALPHCNNSIPDQTVLTMRKLPITYSDKSEDEGGYICHACAHQRVGPITQLMISQEVLQTMDVKLENIVLPRYYEALLQVI